jgi:hypothetical protein
MGWAAIIAAIIELFGPMLKEWLQKWLESRLKKAAERVNVADFGTDERAAKVALLTQAIEDTPRWMPARRMLLRRMKADVERGAIDVADLKDAVALADNE